MSGFMQEFRDFAVKGSVVDMAVGIIIGGAFTLIVKSLVGDMLNPLIGLLIGGVDFANFFVVLKEGAQAAPYASLEAAKEAGAVTLNYGLFINAIISFALVALAVFVFDGQVRWAYGLVLAVGNMSGAFLGARVNMSPAGARWVKWLTVAVIFIIVLKLALT